MVYLIRLVPVCNNSINLVGCQNKFVSGFDHPALRSLMLLLHFLNLGFLHETKIWKGTKEYFPLTPKQLFIRLHVFKACTDFFVCKLTQCFQYHYHCIQPLKPIKGLKVQGRTPLNEYKNEEAKNAENVSVWRSETHLSTNARQAAGKSKKRC